MNAISRIPEAEREAKAQRKAERERRTAALAKIQAEWRTPAPGVAKAYADAMAGERRRIIKQVEEHASPVEVVRFGRDVETGQWRDPDDHNLQRRTPKMVDGHRRVDALLLLHRRGTVTKQHLAAGVRLRDDFELSEGARIQGEKSEVRVEHTLETQIAALNRSIVALAKYRAAVQAVGQRGSGLLLHVVLHNATIASWCERSGQSASVATGYLLAGLDRLEEHYGVGLEDLRRVEG